MEVALSSRIFKRLFAHETCSVLRYSAAIQSPGTGSIRHRSTTSKAAQESIRDRTSWTHRSLLFEDAKDKEFSRYNHVTADQLRHRTTRPKKVSMLMRDFIEDSLYNPNYGYFPKEALIFSPTKPFNFRQMRDERDFEAQLKEDYDAFEDKLDEVEVNHLRQIWHTPVELFKPYYGEAIARYMATNYKISLYPYYDLLIYEMGAGNGTLMLNVLDYLRLEHPEIYERTRYKIIEVSTALASIQAQNVKKTAESLGHGGKVEIINQSIFDWDTYVSSPCFFLALEVFDNFSHDCIRYDPKTFDAQQAHVIIDADGEMFEHYTQQIDPVALRFLEMREITTNPMNGFALPRKSKSLRRFMPGAKTYTQAEYIPTRLMQFFDILHNYFPAHRLVSCDFNRLDTEVEGLNAPVVQTRYERQMVSVTTPLVEQGHFDIMFPTNFKVAELMYRAITGKLTRVMAQEDFLQRWAYIEDTQTRMGDNPLLHWYKNASVLITV